MPSNDTAARIAALAEQIFAANEAYATYTPLMLDADYDELCAQLAELLSADPHLTPETQPAG